MSLQANIFASQQDRRARRGTVLIIAIFVMAALAGIVLVLSRSMAVEAIAAANQTSAMQASAIEHGAEQYCLGYVTYSDENTLSPLNYTEDQFEAVQLGDGYFWVLHQNYGDESLPSFGLGDESGKLNLNVATDTILSDGLGMDVQTAQTVYGYRTGSTTSGSDTVKGTDFETVEELALVDGMTPQYLWGDGTAPPLGQPANALNASGPISNDEMTSRGIYDLVTVYSIDGATGPDGTAKANLAQGTQALQAVLQDVLGQSRAQTLQQAFQGGGGGGGNQVRNIFDVWRLGQNAGMTTDELDQIAPYITPAPATAAAGGGAGGGVAGATPTPPKGLININFAPREVLMSIDPVNLSQQDVDSIITQRTTNNQSGQRTGIAWLAKTLDPAKAGLIGGKITTESRIYSADILAVSGNGRAFKRVRIVIDASTANTTPKIIYRRDLTDRGWPMDPQILKSLRAGQGPGQLVSSNNGSSGGLDVGGFLR